jgi:hypothetical protein
MTGRAAGYCAGYPVPGFMNPYGGRGLGRAWGRGGGFGMGMAWRRGWGRGFASTPAGAPYYGGPYAAPAPFAPPTRDQELDSLRGQADWLKEQMEAVHNRIAELEKEQD